MDEQFYHGTSFLHHRDPRVKIIGTFLLIIPLALTHSFAVAGFGLLAGLFFLVISHIPLITVCKRLLVVNTFTLFLWLTLPLTYGGPSFFTIGPLAVSWPGLQLAALISLKTNGILLLTISLLATSSVSALGHGLNRLWLPTRLCYLLLYSYRYIFVIHQEYTRLLRAARTRNFVPTSSIHTYRTYGYLFGMTVIKSWNRSKRVQQAMLLRGFSGQLIPLDQPKLRPSDYLFLILIFVLMTSLLAIASLYPGTIDTLPSLP